jgi:hypothetical protein
LPDFLVPCRGGRHHNRTSRTVFLLCCGVACGVAC